MKMEGPTNNENINETNTEISLEGNNWELPTDVEFLEPVEDALENRLVKAGWDTEQIYWIILGFHEALVNAIFHGNLGVNKHGKEKSTSVSMADILKENPEYKDKKVYIKVDFSDDKKTLNLEVRDEGEGFKVEEVQDPSDPKHLLETEGKGIDWMRKFFDTVKYPGNGNTVQMSVKQKKINKVL